MDKRLGSQIESIKWLLSIVVLFVLAVFTLPQILEVVRERRETKAYAELLDRIDRIEKRLEIAKFLSSNPRAKAGPTQVGSSAVPQWRATLCRMWFRWRDSLYHNCSLA